MSIDPRELRNAFGRFATGVCVITASPEGQAPFGMTVNSFSSVSLDPPLLLWNLQNDSDCFEAFEKTDRFAVNVLAHDQMAMSNQYAKKNAHELDVAHYEEGELGLPVLHDALTAFECMVWERYPGGDHVILVGEVKAMHDSEHGKPLLFFSGGYAELA